MAKRQRGRPGAGAGHGRCGGRSSTPARAPSARGGSCSGPSRGASPSSAPPKQQPAVRDPQAGGRGTAAFQRLFGPDPELQTGSICSTALQLHPFYYSCGAALPFPTQVPSRALQPSGAASWEADGRLCEAASYLLRNCLCGILTIWKEYENETFSEMELLS